MFDIKRFSTSHKSPPEYSSDNRCFFRSPEGLQISPFPKKGGVLSCRSKKRMKQRQKKMKEKEQGQGQEQGQRKGQRQGQQPEDTKI